MSSLKVANIVTRNDNPASLNYDIPSCNAMIEDGITPTASHIECKGYHVPFGPLSSEFLCPAKGKTCHKCNEVDHYASCSRFGSCYSLLGQVAELSLSRNASLCTLKKIQSLPSSRAVKSRPVPLALQESVVNDLDTMIKHGTLKRAVSSDSPIVTVLNINNQLRICADYTQTVSTVVNKKVYRPNFLNALSNIPWMIVQ
ncbi:unnamed protein product [Lepeophtheirus salmonis]|uniref:(salmon louse) hypothetical protein n=1 Tax=Lepeophtheirus salmonis TaxID=72036 RepID=A0A7R8CRH5_LEPSM|nr:unnamed protein product [Lepeophtheirus salmonis]CAF2905388.1 unnamed protein product [Lepeophtheirus salmonis]